MQLGALLFATIIAVQPIVRLVPNTSDLQTICKTKVKIGACTALAGEKLRCACEPDGEQWRIAATAQYVPVMYLGSMSFREHEDQHLRDIDAALKQYLEQLTAARFDKKETCDLAAADAAGRFVSMMADFKVRSNAKRH